MKILLLASALTIVSAPTLASEPVKAPEAKEAKKEKMVCRREANIGSNIPGKKVCVTKSQYDAQQTAARDAAKELTSGSTHSSGN